MPKGKGVKSTSKSIICNLHDYLIGKVRNRSPLHLSEVRRLMKPLASQNALSTVSCWRRECWMEVPLHLRIRDVRKAENM